MLSQYCSMEEGQGSKIKCFWQEEILVWDRKEEAIWKSGVKFSTYHNLTVAQYMWTRADFSPGWKLFKYASINFFVWLLLLHDKRGLVPDSRCACFILCL